ncbi:MAG: UPF0175 family protein [Candidatus Helarchaeota archaeon]
MLKNIAARIPKELEDDIEDFMKDKGLDKSSAIRKILEIGLDEWKKSKAVELFRLKRVTLWKASEIAGISLREMMDELNRQKIPLHITIQDIEEDIKASKKAAP